MVEALAIMAGLNGFLACILGGFFVFSAFTDHEMMLEGERRRLAVLLGLTFVALGVSSLFVWFTGGLEPYLTWGGSPTVGVAVLVARGVAGVLLLALIVDSLLIWRRARQRAESKREKWLE